MVGGEVPGVDLTDVDLFRETAVEDIVGVGGAVGGGFDGDEAVKGVVGVGGVGTGGEAPLRIVGESFVVGGGKLVEGVDGPRLVVLDDSVVEGVVGVGVRGDAILGGELLEVVVGKVGVEGVAGAKGGGVAVEIDGGDKVAALIERVVGEVAGGVVGEIGLGKGGGGDGGDTAEWIVGGGAGAGATGQLF